MDRYNLDAQKDILQKYAEYQDMTIVSEFSDAGFSGKNITGRPVFSRMMEKIKSENIRTQTMVGRKMKTLRLKSQLWRFEIQANENAIGDK